jgi:hypothetical protein
LVPYIFFITIYLYLSQNNQMNVERVIAPIPRIRQLYLPPS